MSGPAVLRPGSTGNAVRDLQQRLAALGIPPLHDEPGTFGLDTERAVRHFQRGRGLRVDGVCGPDTWGRLVESGFRLGDRYLYRRQPMLRGDDVTALQQRLNALGFDAGREDGILGDDTATALIEFQRNAGIPPDGICGHSTVRALERVGTLAAGSVATVREREELREGARPLAGRRVFTAAEPGLDSLAASVVHGLQEASVTAVLDASGVEGAASAERANRFRADLFFALGHGDVPECRCTYFESGRFRSEAGLAVARSVHAEIEPLLPGGGVCGRSYAVLRETRMAAVICEPVLRHDVEAMRALVTRGDDVARAVVRGIRRGIEQPPEPPDQ